MHGITRTVILRPRSPYDRSMGASGRLGDAADIRGWVGRTEQTTDVLHPTPARALAQTLDQPMSRHEEGAPLPPLWHWLYFLPLVPTAALGGDGHPRRGGFLPPVSLERRMWAGGRLEFHRDLHIGEPVTKTSTIHSVEEKDARVGPMVLVSVRHTIAGAHGVAVEEEQHLAYVRLPDAYAEPPPDPLPDALAWREEQRVDPVVLFRFSALTFNGHRIHYDRAYTMQHEHYPGLVVHGPLQALLLLEAARRRQPGRLPASFRYRALRPMFDHDRCVVAGRPTEDGTELFTGNSSDDVCMRAQVTWR